MSKITDITEEALQILVKGRNRELAKYIETASPLEEVFAGCESVSDVIGICYELHKQEPEKEHKNWDANRLFLMDADHKSFRGSDEPYRRMSLDWELYEAYDENHERDHYEVWIDEKWSENFDTEEEAREYIKHYGA